MSGTLVKSSSAPTPGPQVANLHCRTPTPPLLSVMDYVLVVNLHCRGGGGGVTCPPMSAYVLPFLDSMRQRTCFLGHWRTLTNKHHENFSHKIWTQYFYGSMKHEQKSFPDKL